LAARCDVATHPTEAIDELGGTWESNTVVFCVFFQQIKLSAEVFHLLYPPIEERVRMTGPLSASFSGTVSIILSRTLAIIAPTSV
jgi:uncharacterized PurR-regulated membrane protein YhhQ (DUF165 family)